MLNKLNMFRKTNQMIDLTIVVEVSDGKCPDFGSKYPQNFQEILPKVWANFVQVLGLFWALKLVLYIINIRKIFMVYKSNIFMGI